MAKLEVHSTQSFVLSPAGWVVFTGNEGENFIAENGMWRMLSICQRVRNAIYVWFCKCQNSTSERFSYPPCPAFRFKQAYAFCILLSTQKVKIANIDSVASIHYQSWSWSINPNCPRSRQKFENGKYRMNIQIHLGNISVISSILSRTYFEPFGC